MVGQCFSTRVSPGFSKNVANTGPSLPQIGIMSCHGICRPATSTITTNDSLEPGCLASFIAIVMVDGLPAPWQHMTVIQGRQHSRPPSAFRGGQKSISSRPDPPPTLYCAAGAK